MHSFAESISTAVLDIRVSNINEKCCTTNDFEPQAHQFPPQAFFKRWEPSKPAHGGGALSSWNQRLCRDGPPPTVELWLLLPQKCMWILLQCMRWAFFCLSVKPQTRVGQFTHPAVSTSEKCQLSPGRGRLTWQLFLCWDVLWVRPQGWEEKNHFNYS